MSESAERSAYDPPLDDRLKAPHVMEEQQSRLLMDEKSKIQQRSVQHHLLHWRWEIYTFVLGTASFASILALLIAFREKPPPTVPLGRDRIQLTAIIAALAQVAQSAFLVPVSYCIGQLKWEWFQRTKRTVDLDRFDQASRGPDGSIRLLWFLSWRQRLVSLGALATILLLLFPTFVQQSVQLGKKDIVEYDSALATMPRSTNIFLDPQTKVKLPLLAGNGTSSLYEIDMTFSTAITSGATGYSTAGGLIYADSDSAISGSCGSGTAKCSWSSFYTLALCSSTSDISNDIVRNGDHVTLPALQSFLRKGEDPPSFQSGLHMYLAQSQSAATNIPTTSTGDGTNLPNLAEIYYLYYNVCADRESRFDKTNPARWTALRGQFQFCVQKEEAYTTTNMFSETTILNSTSNLNWYNTTKYDEPAFCTKIDSEKEDFCVAESVMRSLSIQMMSIFNTSASFSDMDRTDISYSTEWGPHLTRAVFGGDSDTAPSCPIKSNSTTSWGGGNPYVRIGQYGFGTTLKSISDSLSDAFRYHTYLVQEVNGTYTYQITVMKVDLRWFILPAALYVIVAVFFVMTILTTRDTPMWKSSPLPLLRAMKEDDGVGSSDEVRKEAKESQLKLRRAAIGWRLVNETEASGS